MKRVWFVASALVTAAGSQVGCGGGSGGAGSDATEAGSSADDAGSRGDARLDARVVVEASAKPRDSSTRDARRADVEPAEAGRALITVHGTVTDIVSGSAPIAGRGIDLLDAIGESHTTFTDSMGAFVVSGVASPYSLTVEADDTAVAMAYLGLSAPNPEVLGYGTAPGTTYSGNVSLSVQLPMCGSSECQLFVNATVNGIQANWSSVTAAPGTVMPVSFDPSWLGTSKAPASVAVNLLVANSTSSSYWYTALTTSLANGATASLGTVSPAAVPLATTFTVTSTAYGAAASWPLAEQIALNYPSGGGTVYLANAKSTTLSAGVPDILGATISATASAFEPTDSGANITLGGGYQIALPLTAASASLAVYPPATWTVPSSSGASVPSNATLSWAPYPPASPEVSCVVLASADATGDIVYVMTSGTRISLADLATMRVPLTPGSSAVLLLEFRTTTTLDAMVAAGSVLSVLNGVTPGETGAAESRLAFTLTP